MTYDELKAAYAAGAWIYGIEDDGKLHQIEDPKWTCPADRYVALVPYIAELGQEVGAVAWTDDRGLERLREGKQEMVSGVRLGSDTTALYLSPAHTSEARDAARYRWLKDRSLRKSVMDSAKQNGPFIAVGSPIGGFHVPIQMDNAVDAAMRQEAE